LAALALHVLEKTLDHHLKELEDFGLIKRTIIPGRPVQIEYSLTDKGIALEPILAHIAAFSARYEAKTIFKTNLEHRLHRNHRAQGT
jgi:DNA-binding HxlR family transcriptional regulator